MTLKYSENTYMPCLWRVLSHVYFLQPLRQLALFTNKELYSEWLGGLSEVTG